MSNLIVKQVGQLVVWDCEKCKRTLTIRFVDLRNTLANRTLYCSGNYYNVGDTNTKLCDNWVSARALLEAIGETVNYSVNSTLPKGDRDL